MKKLALVAVAAVGLACAQARADAVYQFTTFTYGTNFGLPGLPLTVVLDISNESVARGSFAISGMSNGAGGPTQGNVNDLRLISFSAGGITEGVRANYLYGSINAAFTFNTTTGSLLTEQVYFGGISTEALLSGSSGLVGSDAGGCNSSVSEPARQCYVSGSWSVVPEPISASLLLVGLAGFAVTRKRTQG